MPIGDDSIRVRPARPSDAGPLAELAARTMRETYGADHDAAQLDRHVRENLSRDRISAELADLNVKTLLAGDGERLAGYATLKSGSCPPCVRASAPIELSRIYVARDRIGTGVGSALMEAALRESFAARRDVIWLGVWDRNRRAREFYARWAFRDAGTMPFVFGGVEYEDRVVARPVVNVREVRADEGPALREVRIRALREAPRAFLTTARQAEALPDEEWEERARVAAAGKDRTILFAFAPASEKPCGMVAALPRPDRADTRELVQMWVDPAHRGRGVGRALVEAVVAWCGGRGLRVHLGVADDNGAAVALYRSAGFRPTGETEPHPDLPGVRIVCYAAAPDAMLPSA